MSRDYAALPHTHVRRQDRAVTDKSWIREFLNRAPFGTMAMVSGDQPFVNSNIFVYDEAAHAIYLHTAQVGRTKATVETHHKVCFSVSEMGRLLPASVAMEFSVEYAGVTAFGTAHVVVDPVEAEHGLQILLDKYAPHLHPGRDYRAIMPEELKRTAVYRIDIEQWSGKKKEVDADFPGAYRFGEQKRAAPPQFEQEHFLISTNREKLDVDLIFEFLSQEAYWSQGISRKTLDRYLQHSFCFGLYERLDDGLHQIGFARAMTDYTTMAHLADVFVLKSHRDRGLGTWLVNCVLQHPELATVRQWTLNTHDAHDLYRRFGFEIEPHSEHRMRLHRQAAG